MSTVKSDIEIAREAKMKPIMEIGKGLGDGIRHFKKGLREDDTTSEEKKPS